MEEWVSDIEIALESVVGLCDGNLVLLSQMRPGSSSKTAQEIQGSRITVEKRRAVQSSLRSRLIHRKLGGVLRPENEGAS